VSSSPSPSQALSRAKSVQPLSVPLLTHVILPSPTAGLLSAHSSTRLNSESDFAYVRFLHDYPQYASSWHVDALRRSEYSRLAPDVTYVDYMGGALYLASSPFTRISSKLLFLVIPTRRVQGSYRHPRWRSCAILILCSLSF
jgi:hypothetical protein